ncbi:MAG: AraC family transcriptional regulator [Alphaproteobacteria bacterium]|nr:AraC family transcriptional regulator [Alphaproteobacteria bacterium]
MTYVLVPPPRPLRRLIESFSYWEDDCPTDERRRAMAAPGMSLQITLSGSRLNAYLGERLEERRSTGALSLSGVQTRPFGFDAYQARFMRVRFRPGGAFAFFRPPPGELRNAHLSLEDIWGCDAGLLQERLAEASSIPERFRILADALIAAAPRPFANAPAVAQALCLATPAPHRVRAADLAKASDLSMKRFIHLFTEEVGVTPKLFLRIARFERLLARIFPQPSVDWCETAQRHGYFDQSHMIRDFRDFAGMTPVTYFANRSSTDYHSAAMAG